MTLQILGQLARHSLALLILGLVPLALTANEEVPTRAEIQRQLESAATVSDDVKASLASCVSQCETVRNECADARDSKTCLTEERLCIAVCDPAAVATETRRARAENALYQERPDLLRMRLDHERPRQLGAACRQRCDDSARACVEASNSPEPCHEARNICRERCPGDEDTAE